KIGLVNFVMDTNSARCVNCNGRLESVKKVGLENKVPTGVYERQEQFWICVDCQKIYWAGTHFKKLQEFVARLNQRLR
ncbi:MAG: Mut7-C RNAse domain-containing protein, partial [Nitrosopumilaceae archaeon]